MPTFIYQAKNERGQIVSGTVSAENERVASQTLWQNRLKVISLAPKPILPSFSFWGKVSISDKAILARQLSTMISAGIHLANALKICQNQTQSKKLKEALSVIIRDIEGGYSLSTALSKHPDIFDRVFISVIKAGEAAGKLDQVFVSLADRLEKDAAFRGKVKSALIYPIFVFLVLLAVGFLMIIKVIPQLKLIFEESGAHLPWTTRSLIWTSNFLIQYWWTVLMIMVLITVILRLYIKSSRGANWWNNLIIKLPFWGDLNKSILMARFTRTFALLVKTGIPILDALYILSDIMDNEIYKKSLYKIAEDVEKGIPLSVPLSRDKNFPPVVAQMAGVGEQTGALDQVLDRLGIFYEEEVDRKTKAIGALIEPIVIVILGIGIGILVFSILMPIYQLAQIQ